MKESLWDRMASAWIDAEGKDVTLPLSSARWRLVWRRSLAAPLGDRDFDRLRWEDFVDEVRGPWRSMDNPARVPVMAAPAQDLRAVAVRLGLAPRVAMAVRVEVEAVYGAAMIIIPLAQGARGMMPLPDPIHGTWAASSRLRWTDMSAGLPDAVADAPMDSAKDVLAVFPQARPGDMVRVEARYDTPLGPLYVPLPEVWAVPAPEERGRRPRKEAPGIREAERAMLVDVLKEALENHGVPRAEADRITLSALRLWARGRSKKPR